jgi:hypothetical protein
MPHTRPHRTTLTGIGSMPNDPQIWQAPANCGQLGAGVIARTIIDEDHFIRPTVHDSRNLARKVSRITSLVSNGNHNAKFNCAGQSLP